MSHKEIHGAGYKGKGHYRGDRFQMGCQERFQGVTGEKPDQIGTGTGQKKPGGHREQVYEAVETDYSPILFDFMNEIPYTLHE